MFYVLFSFTGYIMDQTAAEKIL